MHRLVQLLNGLAGVAAEFCRCLRSGSNDRCFCEAVLRAGGRTGEPGALILAWTAAYLDIDSDGAAQVLSQQC